MIDYTDNGDFIECYSYCFEKSYDILLGAIREGYAGYYVFHPARKVTLNCGLLSRLSAKLSEMNTGVGNE